MLKLIVIKSSKYYLLDLGNTKSISFELNSGIWNFDSIPGTFSIPFTVPASVTNNAVFDFPHSQTNTNQNKRIFDCQLLINGLLFYEGSITVSETTTGDFKCSLKLNQSKFIENNVDKLLNESNFGGTNPWVWKSYYDIDNSNFALYEHTAVDFFKGTIAEDYNIPETTFNTYDLNDQRYVLQYVIEQTQNSTIRPYIICPQPFLFKTLNLLFQNLGYFVNNNCFELTDEFKRLCIHNINNITDIIMTEPLQNIFRYTTLLDNYNLNQSMPKITIQDFILNLKNFFCIDFKFKNNNLQINFIKDYILSVDFIDITDKCITDETKTWRTTGQTFEIKFGEFFRPDIDTKLSPRDIILEKCKGDIIFDYDNGLGIDPLKVGDAYVIIRIQSSEIFYRNIRMSNAGQIEEYNELFPEISNGAFKTQFLNYFMSKTADLSFDSKIAPFYNTAGSGNSNMRIEYVEFPLCLAFNTFRDGIGWIGDIMNNQPGLFTFILSTFSNLGLYNTFFKPFLDWFTNIPYEIEKEIQFSLLDLKNFDFSKKYLIKNKLYFINKIQFAIDIEGNINVSTCTLLPC